MCGRRDSNPQSWEGGRFKGGCVCQFRHTRAEVGPVAVPAPDDYRRNRKGIAPFLGFRRVSGAFDIGGFIQIGAIGTP